MKKLLNSVAAIAFMLGGAQSAAAQETLNIGYPPSLDMLPGIVAHESGCIERAGYKSTLTPIPIATNIPPALLAGSLQIGMSTPTILLPAVENGVDLVVVAGSSVMKAGNEGLSFVTRPELGVTKAAQLKGLKVGVPGIMSVADLVFRKWLKVNGVDPSDVTFIEVPFPRMAEMMKSKTVDAVVTAQPVLGMLVSTGLAERKAGEYYSEIADGAIITFWSATGEWAKANPDAIAAFRKCLDEAVAWIGTDRAAAGEISKKYLKFNPDYTPTWRTDVTPQDFDSFVKMSREFDLLRTDIDTAKLFVVKG